LEFWCVLLWYISSKMCWESILPSTYAILPRRSFRVQQFSETVVNVTTVYNGLFRISPLLMVWTGTCDFTKFDRRTRYLSLDEDVSVADVLTNCKKGKYRIWNLFKLVNRTYTRQREQF
jgi:hypothetical protein